MRRLAPLEATAHVDMLLRHESGQPARDVPAPYYGEPADFERVLDCVETGSRQWLNQWFPPR